MIDEPNLERMELIQRYQQIERDLQAMIDNGRPPCPVLAGDLMEVAGKLGCIESAQDFIRGLQEQAASKTKSTGCFSGVTGYT